MSGLYHEALTNSAPVFEHLIASVHTVCPSMNVKPYLHPVKYFYILVFI